MKQFDYIAELPLEIQELCHSSSDKYGVLRAYNTGLRDGAKREQPAETPAPSCTHAILVDGVCASCGAFITLAGPAETPAPQPTEQAGEIDMLRFQAAEKWFNIAMGCTTGDAEMGLAKGCLELIAALRNSSTIWSRSILGVAGNERKNMDACTLKKLQELDKLATAGPWKSTADTEDIEEPVDRILDTHGDIIAKVWPDTGLVGGFEQSQNDGRFIASARNNLPQLLRIAEAAMELCECVKLVKLDDNAPDFLVSDAIAELREAIGGDDDNR